MKLTTLLLGFAALATATDLPNPGNTNAIIRNNSPSTATSTTTVTISKPTNLPAKRRASNGRGRVRPHSNKPLDTLEKRRGGGGGGRGGGGGGSRSGSSSGGSHSTTNKGESKLSPSKLLEIIKNLGGSGSIGTVGASGAGRKIVRGEESEESE